jgi:predicted nucleic acid-binding protein
VQVAGLHGEPLWSVAHLDAEVFSALSRLHRNGRLTTHQVSARLGLLGDLAVDRLPITPPLLDAAWDLRHDIAARDALYVATASSLDARLLTTDQRLARAVPDLAVPFSGDDAP